MVTTTPFDDTDPVMWFIEHFEGIRLVAYRCPAGVWTIGIGHTGGVKPGSTMTLHQAKVVLTIDVDRAEHDVLAVLDRDPTRNELRAMTSLAFNIGGPAFQSSTLRRRFNAGANDATDLAQGFLMWCKAHAGPEGALVTLPGLLERRKAEVALFLRPDDEPFAAPPPAAVGGMPQAVHT